MTIIFQGTIYYFIHSPWYTFCSYYSGSSDYRYGFRDPNSNYRSILAYDCKIDQCDNMPNGSCTRQQFVSTPVQADWKYNGQRQGWSSTDLSVGETNNAKKINDVAAHIAGFYDSSPVTPSPSKAPTKSPTKSPVTPTCKLISFP